MDIQGNIQKAKEARIAQADSTESSVSAWCCACVSITVAVLTVILTICLAVAFLGLGIAKLVIGGLYFHDCDLQPLIPIFLIVDATVGFVFGGSSCDSNQSDDTSVKACKNFFRGIVFVFSFTWLIFGTVWVTEVRSAIYSPDHCKNVTMSTTTPAAFNDMDISAITTSPNTDVTSTDSLILSVLTNSTPMTNTAASTLSEGSGIEKCQTCNSLLVDFTFVVVIIQLVIYSLAIVVLICSIPIAFCASS